MSLDAWLTLGLLGATLALLLGTKLPPAAVFLGALTVSITLGLAPVDASLSGFSNNGVLTVGALFMVAAGMYSTGAISLIGDRLIGRPKSEEQVQARVLPPVAIGSAFLNNTPLVAMMIPVIRDLCRNTGLAASKLFIPLSFASILGGTTTLIGTSVNLIIGGLILDEIARGNAGAPPMREIQMFDPSWVAVPAAVLGIAFIVIAGRWLLPERRIGVGEIAKRVYGAEFVLLEESGLIGRTLEETGASEPTGFELRGLWRADGSPVELKPAAMFAAGDVVAVSADIDALPDLWTTFGVRPLKEGHPMTTPRYTHSLVEVVVSPQSSVVGRLISDLPLPDSPYRFSLVGVSRAGKPLEERLDDIRIEVGDNAVLEVDDAFCYVARNEQEFSLQKPLEGYRIRRWHRAAAATVIMVAMVTVVTLGWMSMLNAALLATGAMLLSGCMSLRSAAHSVDFATLVALAAAIGVAAAVSESGLADAIARGLRRVGAGNPYGALAAVFVGHVIMGNLITTAASAVFMFPIAVSLAGSLGVSFMPFAITLMIGMVGATITPAAYQTNLMVYEPGGYTTWDFVRLGVPLTLLVGAVTIFLAPVAFPF
ncbi:MAG: SLC13 family permease [Candidatus Palauibacterales bacterium]|nr:SLC13 family permease [Candidatus Palauibacterales bacterium]